MDKDNKLTPLIQRLMYFAQDKPTAPRYNAAQFGRGTGSDQAQGATPTVHMASDQSSNLRSMSSGILDLEHCDEFGKSLQENISLGGLSTFNAGEMTGRSTDAEEVAKLGPSPSLLAPPSHLQFGRCSVNSIESLTKKMNQQSNDVKELMRQSIASTYSFHSRRDLTADEASLVLREAPLPVPAAQINLKDSMIVSEQGQDSSVGAYFQNRCVDFSQMLPRTDSPNYDTSCIMDESLIHVPDDSASTNYKDDGTLDSIPVRQPKPKLNVTSTIVSSSYTKTACIEAKTVMPPPKAIPDRLYSKPEENNSSGECDSLSISRIAGILDKESILSVSDMFKHIKHPKQAQKKHPLTEIDFNSENRQVLNKTQVTTLMQSKESETASSAGTINTVIDLSKLELNQENIQPFETRSKSPISKSPRSKSPRSISPSMSKTSSIYKSPARSKSPSGKSTATFSTVQENLGSTTLHSGDSPLHLSRGPAAPHKASPTIHYRELDKSVDWHDVIQSKSRTTNSLPKEQWAEVTASAVEGYVGVNTPATVTIQSQSDSWLRARFQFDVNQSEITIDLPRFPILIPPGKAEQFTINITSNNEINGNWPYTVYLKDSSKDSEVELKGDVAVKVKMPTLQAVSSGGMNKVVFQPIQEGTTLSKTFVLISDCLAVLQLDLSIVGPFTINSVQEIKKSDVTKKLLDCQEEKKSKGRCEQMGRLSNGIALKVSVTFTAPKLNEAQIAEKTATFNGSLNVHLIGVNLLLMKVDLIAMVGTANLVCQLTSNKLHLTSEVTSIPLTNAGTVRGAWAVKFKEEQNAFKLYSNMLEVDPGATVPLKVTYAGPEDKLLETILEIEDSSSRVHLSFQLSGGQDRPKTFPVKTSCAVLSFVRAGRKEISLKNSTDKRIQLRCRVVGEGFYIDLPRGTGKTILLTFGPLECRALSVVFKASSNAPVAAALHLAYERDTEISRKVCLYGAAGGAPLKWQGVMTTEGHTALVRVMARQPITLKLASRCDTPTFISAKVHFNLKYLSVSATARLAHARCVVPPRGVASLTLHVDWALVERRAAAARTALGAVTVLSGAELTRHRILRVLRKESGGKIDVASLPEHLQRLTGPFEAEDPAMDNLLKDFHETKSSLDELVSELEELTAQLELPPELGHDDATILLADDTVIDHHTLCE